jgi:hypothetical protein
MKIIRNKIIKSSDMKIIRNKNHQIIRNENQHQDTAMTALAEDCRAG